MALSDSPITMRRDVEGLEHLVAQLQTLTSYPYKPLSISDIQQTITNITWKDITGDIKQNAALQQALNNVINDVKDLIKVETSSLFIYKGSVKTEKDLPKSGNEIGYCYNVEDTGANYAWNGSKWDKLSETIDLSAYITKDILNDILQPLIDEITALDLTFNTINATIESQQTEIDEIKQNHADFEQKTKTDIETLSEKIDNIEIPELPDDIKSSLETINKDIEDIKETQTNQATRLETINTSVEKITDDVTNINSIMDDVVEVLDNTNLVIESITKDLGTTRNNIEDIKTDVTTIQNDIEELKNKEDQDLSNFVTTETLQNKVDDINTTITDTKDELSTKINKNETDIKDLQNKQDNTDSTIENITDKVEEIETDINNVLNYLPQIEENKTEISNIKLDIQNQETKISNIENIINAGIGGDINEGLLTQLNNISTQVNTNTTDIQTNKNDIATINNKLDGFCSLTDITDLLKDNVKYSYYPDGIRKAIVLNNHDSLTGTLKDGSDGVNLIMLSKWDVVDVGSNKVHLNLNTDDRVTINDTLYIATTSDIEELEQTINTKLTEINTKIDDINTDILTLNDNIDTVGTQVLQIGETIDNLDNTYIKKDELDLSEYIKNEDIKDFISKEETQEKIDKLNTSIGKDITIINNTLISHDDDLTEIKNKLDSIPTNISQLINDVPYLVEENITDILIDYAPMDSLPTKLSELENDTNFVTKDEITTPDNVVSNETFTEFKTEITTKQETLEKHIKDVVDLFPTKLSDFENDTNFITEEIIDELLENYVKIEAIENIVKYNNFTYNGQTRKTIQLNNYDSISGIDTQGAGHNLIMLSKWDVADIGAPGIHANINTKDNVTINDNLIIATNEDIDELKTEIDKVNTRIDNINISGGEGSDVDLSTYMKKEEFENYKTIHDDIYTIDRTEINNNIDTTNGYIQTLEQKLELLEVKFNDMKTSLNNNSEFITLFEGNDEYYENKERDYYLSGACNVPLQIKSHSCTLQDLTVNAATIDILCTDDITIKNIDLDGDYPKEMVGNSLMGLHSDSFITIRDSVIDPETCYNGIEIGLNTGLAKGILIDNVEFKGVFNNNAINIFGQEDNCVITISNCTFNSVSNVLRLSNRTNENVIVNIINCKINNWDTSEYAGLVLLQDYTSENEDACINNNLFNKITINLHNVTKPNGEKISQEDIDNNCGTGNSNQIIYVYDKYRGIVPYDVNVYPKINLV